MFVQFAYGKQSPSHLPPCFACVRRAKLSETEFNFCCFRENCCPVVGSCFCYVWKMCFCCFYICFLRIEQLKASPGSSRSPFSSSPSTKVFIASHFLCVHSNKFHLRNCFQKRKSIFQSFSLFNFSDYRREDLAGWWCNLRSERRQFGRDSRGSALPPSHASRLENQFPINN